MTLTNMKAYSGFDQIIETLYSVRKSLIWTSFRLTDEMYEDASCRDGMAMDLDQLAQDVEFVMAELGIDLYGDRYGVLEMGEERDCTPLGKRWRDFWIARAKKISGGT